MQDPLGEAAAAATGAGCVRRAGGSIYFRVSDATDVLNYYRRIDATLLAMEAFELENGAIRPRLDMILDCGSGDESERCFQTAVSLIEEWKTADPSVVIDFIVASPT